MKAKLLFALFALVLLVGIASAQSYHIQVANNTNLRESYSLESAVVATAPAGTTLLVTGQFGKWLKINRDGEVWMANWVRHSRVDAPATAAQPANIDNCCFVDRQCSSDQEWTDGYWAFQNGHCAAPAQAQSPAPAQSSSSGSAPANVDNCCFIGWACATEDDWKTGFIGYQTNQCEHPGVAIGGSADFVVQVKAALDILRERSPNWYAYAVQGLNRVDEIPAGHGAGTYGHGKSFYVAYDTGGLDESALIWLAISMVHEACHIVQYEDIYHNKVRAPITIEEAEAECTRFMLYAAEAIDPLSRFNNWLRTLIANIHDPAYQWWN